MGTIRAVCISEKKGTGKQNIGEALLVEDYGLKGDAHAGKWHRQVSLLSCEKVEEFKERGALVQEGDFGENLLVEGFDFKNLPVGTVFQCGEALLEMTQIGKECHSHCAIHEAVGDCIMPREGVFAKVLRGGTVRVGDQMEIVGQNYRFRVGVVTMSDKGAAGEREDTSGPLIRELVEKEGYLVVDQSLIPDDRRTIEETLIRLADRVKVDLILTTGGTGFSMRDVTPEATLAVADRNVPGIAEAIRAYSLTITPRAMLSRAASAIRGRTLIVNLPGSPKAVRESLSYILPALSHGLDVLTARVGDCASDSTRTKKKNPVVLSGILAAAVLTASMGKVSAKGAEEEPTKLLLAAAASLEYSMEEKLIPLFEEQNPGITVEGTYDSSGKLQTQIEEGLEADLFISAAEKQMDALIGQELIQEEDKEILLENKIVAIVPKDSEFSLDSFEDLTKVEILALGDPDSVPAGQYAREVFTSLGLWEEIQDQASFGTNVTEVLNWVAEHSADAGVVYATDAAVRADAVEVIAEAPEGSLEKPVLYPAAVLERTEYEEAARAFLTFLKSDEAGEIFREYGFTPYREDPETETEEEAEE